MYFRLLAAALMSGVAFSGAALAQTAPAPATPAAPTQQGAVPLAEPGLTASPTDFGTIQAQGAGQGRSGSVTPGGVNRQDLGGGYMIEEDATKSRSTVTRDAIDKLPPTANPYQMIDLLPGVIETSSDNVGLNGGNIKMRGFNSDHIGLTIEGMPINDSGNYALYPQEYVDSENISQISVAQGAPDLDSPHIGAAGGVINIYMRDPSKTYGALVDFSAGSHDMFREFARVDSGQVGNVRAYVSYSHMGEDHWTGPGRDERDNFELKTVWDVSPGNTIRFSAIYNHEMNNFYNTLSLPQFQADVKPSYLGAVNTSTYYGYKINPFDNLILSAPSNFTINSNLTFDTIPYYWYGDGNGGGVTAMSSKAMYWGDLKITNAGFTGQYDYDPSVTVTNRPGIINKLTYTVGDHKIVAGYWFEYATQAQTGPFAALNADGSVADPFVDTGKLYLPVGTTCQLYNYVTKTTGATVACPTGPMEKRDTLTTTMTNMFFVGDTWNFAPQWTLESGVKEVLVHRTVDDYMPGAIPSDTLDNNSLLPTVGVRFKPNDQNQFWASVATTFHSAPNYTLAQTFSSTAGTIAPINVPPPEYGEMFEIGHRYQGSLFATSVSAFLGHFTNYQVSTYELDPSGSNSQVSVTMNAGGLLTYGVDGEFGTRPINNFRPYVSAELMRTEILDNMPAASVLAGNNINDFLPTKGKQLPGAPNFSAGFGLDYDDGHWFGNLAYKYQGAQYSSFMNDQEMPGFGRLNGAIGYRFSDIGFVKAPEIKLSLSNLLNSRQMTGINSIVTNALPTIGTKGGTIQSSTPYYYVGEGFSAMLTARAAF